jgi:hypothetical protein
MDPISILTALTVIFSTFLVTGFIISKFLIKECSSMERLGFSMAFGSCFLYFIYFILKNSISLLNLPIVLAVIGAMILIYLIKYGSGKKFFGWLFANRRE